MDVDMDGKFHIHGKPGLRTVLALHFNPWTTYQRIVSWFWRSSVVVGELASINVVNRHWARLVLGSVTTCGRVNHLGM